MNAKAETRSISMEYDLPHPPAKVRRALTEPGFRPDNASAFDGASKGWQRMVGERLREVLAAL